MVNAKEVVIGIDPGVPNFMVMGYREGDKVVIMEEGHFVVQGVISSSTADESHIVRGYD